MAALVLLALGFALLLGWEDLAKRLVRPLIGLVIVLSVLPPLVESCAVGPQGDALPSRGEVHGLFVLLSLILLGFILWRTRAYRQRQRDAWARRHGQARRRALPPPPFEDETDAPAPRGEEDSWDS